MSDEEARIRREIARGAGLDAAKRLVEILESRMGTPQAVDVLSRIALLDAAAFALLMDPKDEYPDRAEFPREQGRTIRDVAVDCLLTAGDDPAEVFALWDGSTPTFGEMRDLVNRLRKRIGP